MFNTELLQQAEDEMSTAYEWYEKRVSGLGAQFYKVVDHYLNLISANPFHFPVRYIDDLRAAALDRFPFLIIYWIDEPTQSVFVASIFHTSRKPQRLS